MSSAVFRGRRPVHLGRVGLPSLPLFSLFSSVSPIRDDTPAGSFSYLVPVHKWLFSAISALDSDFNPQNTQCIPAVKIFVFIDLAENISFLDGHYLPPPFFSDINEDKEDTTMVMPEKIGTIYFPNFA